jgi:hypothetical protein
MDWIKENKFLSGWLAVTLLGALALGFLLFQAKGKHAEAQEAYETKAAELATLQGKKPYPDEDNLKKMGELQKAHQAGIDELHKQLVAMEIPLTPMTPEKFQDELRESVRRVTAKAAERGVKIGGEGKTFYMGFDKYQSERPKEEAAAPLGRMLKAMELAIMNLIEAGPTDITDLKREILPEEGSEKDAKTPATPAKGKEKAADKPDLVARRHFDVSFVAVERNFRSFVNGLVASKQQFFIPKSVIVKNEKEQGPPKAVAAAPAPFVPPPVDPNAPADPNAPPAAAPAAPTAPVENIKFIVGDEKLQVAMRIDVVDFADLPAAKTAK